MEKVIAIDYERCTGCRRCELACSLHHFGECNPKLSCIRLVFLEETKETFPVSCTNCSTPICLDLCPVKAISIDVKTTAVVIDRNRCIGCKTCVIHCPFGAAGFDPHTRVSFKCDLCGGEPLCTKFCPSGALKFLPLDEFLDIRRRDFANETRKAQAEGRR